jgi:ABC-type proline/glycine betaine transport system permease subunit
MPNPGEVIKPRLTAMTKSAIPRTFQTTRAYLDQLNPFLRKYAKGMAVTPIKISPTPTGIPYTMSGVNRGLIRLRIY